MLKDAKLGIRIPTLLCTGYREIQAHRRKCQSLYDFYTFIFIFIQQIITGCRLGSRNCYIVDIFQRENNNTAPEQKWYLWPTGLISLFSLILSSPEKVSKNENTAGLKKSLKAMRGKDIILRREKAYMPISFSFTAVYSPHRLYLLALVASSSFYLIS